MAGVRHTKDAYLHTSNPIGIHARPLIGPYIQAHADLQPPEIHTFRGE